MRKSPPPFIPHLPRLTSEDCTRVLHGRFDPRQPQGSQAGYSALRKVIAERAIALWTRVGSPDDAPQRTVIENILERYVRVSVNATWERHERLLHATFNSLHPRYFAVQQARWDSVKRGDSGLVRQEFAEPLFWTDEPVFNHQEI